MDLRKQFNHRIGVLPEKARKRLPMCQGHQLPDIIHEPFAPWLLDTDGWLAGQSDRYIARAARGIPSRQRFAGQSSPQDP
jgi:hypothetical protein